MKNKNKKAILILLAIFVHIIFFFVYYKTKAVYCDESMLILNARNIIDRGTDVFGEKFPIYFDTWVYGGQSPFATYLTALAIKIFGYSLIVSRIPMLIFSIISLFCFYGLLEELFSNKRYVNTIFILMAFSPFHIFYSAWTFDCEYFPILFLIATMFLVKAINKKNECANYIFAMLFYSLCFYSYIASVLVVPIFLCITYLYLIINKKIRFKMVLISVLTMVMFSLPFILFGLVKFNIIREFTVFNISFSAMPYYSRETSISIFSGGSIFDILKAMGSNFSFDILAIIFPDFLYSTATYLYTNFVGGLLFVIGFLYFYIKVLKKSNEFSKTTKILLIVITITALMDFLLVNEMLSVNLYRIHWVFYFVSVFEGIGLIYIYNKFLKSLNYKIVLIVFLAISMCIFGLEFEFVFKEKIQTSAEYSGTAVSCFDEIEKQNINDVKIVNSASKDANSKISTYLYQYYYDTGNFKSSFFDQLYYRGIESNEMKDKIVFNDKYTYVTLQNGEKLTAESYIISSTQIKEYDVPNNYSIADYGKFSLVYR